MTLHENLGRTRLCIDITPARTEKNTSYSTVNIKCFASNDSIVHLYTLLDVIFSLLFENFINIYITYMYNIYHDDICEEERRKMVEGNGSYSQSI